MTPIPFDHRCHDNPDRACPSLSLPQTRPAASSFSLRSFAATTTRTEAYRLSVRLLVAGPGAGTAELLGLAATVVGDEQGAVELDEGLLEHVLGVLVDELLVVGDEGLGDGLTDGVDLRGVATTGDADADVDVGELVEADNQERLVDLWESKVLVSVALGM
jgi:hypothetical protein